MAAAATTGIARASLRAGARRRIPARSIVRQSVLPQTSSRGVQTSATSCYEVAPAAQKQTPVPAAPWAASSPRKFRSESIPAAASSSSSASQPSSTKYASSHSSQTFRPSAADTHLPANLRMRNLLRDCAQLFAPSSPLASHAWRERLDLAAQRLGQAAEHLGTSRPLRIGVVGDPQSGADDFIATLFDDPLVKAENDDVPLCQTIRQVWQDLKREQIPTMLVTQDEKPSQRARCITSAHPLLRDNNVEFLQLDPAINDSALATMNDMYGCDVLLFITDDATLAAHARHGERLGTDATLQLLRRFASKPHTSLIVNHSGSQLVDVDTLHRGLAKAIGNDALQTLERSNDAPVTHISLQLAQHANDALRKGLKDAGATTPPASVWDHFSSLYQSSSLGDVKRRIFPEVQSASRAREAALVTSSFTLRRALEQALFLIWRDVEYVHQAGGAADVLGAAIDEEHRRLYTAVFSVDKSDNKGHAATSLPNSAVHERAGDRSKAVDGASKDAWNLVEKTFSSRLPWWKILWKIDDVRAETESAIEGAFGKDLEQRLMLETGKLLGVAMRLHRETRALFRDLDKEWSPVASSTKSQTDFHQSDARNPFASPLLLNDLRKHSLENVNAKLRAELLTMPILQRRAQLLARGGPVDVLCSRAQRGVMASVTLTGTAGLFGAISGMAGSSVGAGVGLPAALSILALEPATAGAGVAFAAVFSAWLLQTRWGRAKKRFWRDWERIADGLDDDLRRNLDDVFEKLVAAQSFRAVEGLRGLVTGYLLELEEAQQLSANIIAQLPRPPRGMDNTDRDTTM